MTIINMSFKETNKQKEQRLFVDAQMKKEQY